MKRSVLATLLLSVLLAILGCAATKVQQVWIDETYLAGRPKNVLVIAALNQPTARRMMESEFAKRLKKGGVSATESFRVIDSDEIESSEARKAVVAKIRELGTDAVLLTRVAGIRKSTETIPGMTITAGYGFPYGVGGSSAYASVGYTFPGPSAPTTQGYSKEREFLALETQLFDVRTEKLIWAVRTETRLTGPPQEEIAPYVSLVARKLFDDRIFREKF